MSQIMMFRFVVFNSSHNLGVWVPYMVNNRGLIMSITDWINYHVDLVERPIPGKLINETMAPHW